MDSKVLWCVLLIALFSVLAPQEAVAGPAVDETSFQNSVHESENTSVEEALLKKLNGKCTNRDVSACMMLKLVAYFNRLLKKSQIAVGDFEITQTSTRTSSSNSGSARSLQEIAGMSEDEQFTSVLTDKALDFLKTRSLKWKVLDEAEVVVSGKAEEDGGVSMNMALKPTSSFNGDARKKKDKGGMGTMMAAAALKIGLLKALAFKALVLLVGKALLVSKLALVLAAVIGLKKLFSQEKHVTYEVVAQPHQDHHDHHDGGHDSYGGGGGGWGRNYETANNNPYRAHIPKN